MKLARIATLLTFVLASVLEARNLSKAKATEGVIDFSQTTLNAGDTLALDGQWKFFWQEFIPPDGSPPRSLPINLKVRGTWRNALFEGKKLPAEGWGSYELLVFLPKNAGHWALKIPNIGTAYKLFANGALIAQTGNPAETKDKSIPLTLPVSAPLPAADAGGRVLLVMHVSNFDDRHGGIWQTIRLGSAEHIENSLRDSYTLSAFFFGAIFLIAMHHLLLFIRRPQEKSSLAFAILCLLLAVRALVEGNRYLLVLFPNFPWQLNSKLAYLTFFGSLPPAAWFLHLVFEKQFHRFVLYAVYAILLPICGFVIAAPPRLYSEILTAVQLISLLLILYGVVAIFRAVYAKARGAKTLALGIFALFITAVLDILTVANIINLPELSPFGIIAFIFSQSLVLSMRQEDAFTRLEILAGENKNLIESMELKILERTSTIAEMSAEGDAVLNALSEGVFLINRDHTIGNKISRQVLDILEVDPGVLQQRPFVEVIRTITGADLSEDARLYLNVLFNANMDDAMVEQLNPLEKIALRGMQSHKDKIIHFQFTRQHRRDQIMAAFVSVRDITAEEAARLDIEAREKRSERQLEIVKTLFGVNPEALQAFYESIEGEIDDIDAALSQHGPSDARVRVESVYRAAHTIKGSAQLFKIDFLAEEVHSFEEKLQAILKREKVENLDLIAVNLAYTEMQKALSEFEAMISQILKFQKEISGIRTNAIEMLGESLVKMVAETGEKLGKSAQIRFENFTTEAIPRKLFAPLRDTLVQCVRNSLAHSIETPDERKAAGKSERGEILVAVDSSAANVSISVRDDGKSFDVAAIRRRAIETHLKTEAELAALDDRAIIELIFSPGFSTSEPGGAISGRGAGMDIIAKKIAQWGGKIRIEWARGSFTEFTFVLPKNK